MNSKFPTIEELAAVTIPSMSDETRQAIERAKRIVALDAQIEDMRATGATDSAHELAEVEALYAKGLATREELEQADSDFEAAQAPIKVLIDERGALIDAHRAAERAELAKRIATTIQRQTVILNARGARKVGHYRY